MSKIGSKKVFSYILSVSLAGSLGWIGFASFVHGGRYLVEDTVSAESYKGIYESGVGLEPPSKEVGTYYLRPEAPPPPQLQARGYVVADLLSGNIIIERNASNKYPIASISKLITSVTAIEFGSEFNSDLFYPLLLASSNETADEIAGNFEGELFIQKMNLFAKDLGLKETSFADPSGLSPKNVSSARDLLAITRYIYKEHPEIFALTRVTEKSIVSGGKFALWQNNNLFVQNHHPDYVGGKSGYTPEAGGTLVALFTLPVADGELRPVAVILLGTDNQRGVKYEVAESVIDYILENVYYK